MHISLAGKSACSQDIALPAQMSKVLPPWMDELISNNKIYVCGIEKQVGIKILFHSCILCLQKMKNVASYVWLIVQIGKIGVLWFGAGKHRVAMALWRVFHTNSSHTM